MEDFIFIAQSSLPVVTLFLLDAAEMGYFSRYLQCSDHFRAKQVHIKRCNLMLNFWLAMTAPIACSGQVAQLESDGKALGQSIDLYGAKRIHIKRSNLMLNFWSAMTAPIACSGQAAK